jgi:hypothetical protein
MEMSGQPHAPAALPPGRSPQYASDGSLGVLHCRSGFCGEESVTVTGIEPRFKGFSTDSLVAIPTEVYSMTISLEGRTKTWQTASTSDV